MTTLRVLILATAFLLACLPAAAQSPFAASLADFDKLVAQMNPAALVGAPIRAGEAAVIPFASAKFALASGGAPVLSVGGMGARNVPLGLLIVEGDDVRLELLPEPQDKSGTALHQILQAILDRKVVVIGNGLNIGHASGTVEGLAPLVANLAAILSGSQTALIGNALNLGHLSEPNRRTDSPGPNPAPSR